MQVRVRDQEGYDHSYFFVSRPNPLMSFFIDNADETCTDVDLRRGSHPLYVILTSYPHDLRSDRGSAFLANTQ